MATPALPGLGGLPAASRLLAQRLTETGALPLADIREGTPALRRLSPTCKEILRRDRSSLLQELRGDGARRLAHVMGPGFTGHLMRRNQYLPLPRGWDSWVDDLYSHLLDDLAAILGSQDEPSQPLVAHTARLQHLLGAREALTPGPGDEVVCADYDPALQIAVLRLDPATVPGPVLDLGCGEYGRLVWHLWARGRCDVLGVDALCETDGPLLRASWFEAPLEAGTWGTILAHQSFSLHAWRIHAVGSMTEAARHARAFMSILRALKPGGCFRYAPSLPFLEDLLPPDLWRVERWDVPAVTQAGRPFQATRILRRSPD